MMGPKILPVTGEYAAEGAYSLRFGKLWSDITSDSQNLSNNVKILTIDGALLNRLYLVEGLASGSGIVQSRGEEDQVPVYTDGMNFRELTEFTAQTVEVLDYANVEVGDFSVGSLGGERAVVFSLAAQTDDGLNISGRCLAGVKNGLFNGLIYLAPAEYYFDLHRDEVEAIFRSASNDSGVALNP